MRKTAKNSTWVEYLTNCPNAMRNYGDDFSQRCKKREAHPKRHEICDSFCPRMRRWDRIHKTE